MPDILQPPRRRKIKRDKSRADLKCNTSSLPLTQTTLNMSKVHFLAKRGSELERCNNLPPLVLRYGLGLTQHRFCYLHAVNVKCGNKYFFNTNQTPRQLTDTLRNSQKVLKKFRRVAEKVGSNCQKVNLLEKQVLCEVLKV